MGKTKTEKTAMAVNEASDYAILKIPKERRTELMAMALGDGVLEPGDLDRAMPGSNGAEHFVIPTLDGERVTDCVEGVVIGNQRVRVFWNKKIGSGPPSCSSADLEHGKGTPGGDCEACPYSQWGSDLKGGKGQACQLRHVFFFVVSDAIFPLVLNLSPTSLKAGRAFLKRCASNGRMPYEIVTQVTLKTCDGENGPFARVIFKGGEKLAPEAAARFKEVAGDLAKYIRRTAGAVAASGEAE